MFKPLGDVLTRVCTPPLNVAPWYIRPYQPVHLMVLTIVRWRH